MKAFQRDALITIAIIVAGVGGFVLGWIAGQA